MNSSGSSNNIDGCFSPDYFTARERFLEVCRRKNLEATSYINPASEEAKAELAVDTAFIGNRAAQKILVITSGFHGVELMCGSDCQTGLIENDYFLTLPEDIAVLQVHGVNPWGAAYLRRNNEDNVDLCRNFLDFNEACPVNSGYETIHEALCCPEAGGSRREEAEKVLQDYRQRHGLPAFINAVIAGQYQHPDGMSYGGDCATWSRQTLEEILRHHAGTAERVCLVDIHSGLGPYGHGSVVCLQQGDNLDRARNWFGDGLTTPQLDAAPARRHFHPTTGHPSHEYQRLLKQAQVTSVVLEFGTYSSENNLKALLDDHWLEFNGDGRTDTAGKIKSDILKAHYPDDPHWRESVWTGCERVIRQSINGLIQ